jgi:hypothetical protein
MLRAMPAHQGSGSAPTRVKRPVEIVDFGVIPRRFGVAQQQQSRHSEGLSKRFPKADRPIIPSIA